MLYKLKNVVEPERILEYLWQRYYPQSKAESGVLYGKPWSTAGRRQTVQVCDDPLLLYHYSGAAKEPAVIRFADDRLLTYLQHLSIWCLGANFPNFCLMNFYTAEGTLGWHSDDERDLEPDSEIVSLSYSTEPRYFEFRAKDNHRHKWRWELKSGSGLLMRGACQTLLQHCVPKQVLPADFRRVNLTFRTIKKSNKAE